MNVLIHECPPNRVTQCRIESDANMAYPPRFASVPPKYRPKSVTSRRSVNLHDTALSKMEKYIRRWARSFEP